MNFSIKCASGEPLSVSIAEAGGTKQCHCGVLNHVPSLRVLNLQNDVPSNDDLIADKLRYMLAAGELPPSKVCVQCGVETRSLLECTVTCERPYTKVRGYWATVLLSCYHVVFAFNRDYRNPEVHGEDLTVATPLPLCAACRPKTSLRGSALRELLCRLPLYAKLFSAYPNATVNEPSFRAAD